jgi:hypothetical protein
MPSSKKRAPRLIITLILSLSGLCLLLVASGALLNVVGSQPAIDIDRLSESEKLRLSEAIHLRQSLGDEVLPGFSQAEIPFVVFNERYLFLVGLEQPAAGWETVPAGKQLGSAWEVVSEDDFFGKSYYRQPLPEGGENTQAFAVKIGDVWVGSLGTLDYMRVSGADQIQAQLPGWLRPIAPVDFFVNRLLLPNSDVYIAGIVHECVHAYQGMMNSQKLKDAEISFSLYESSYPYEDEIFRSNWNNELELLNAAIHSPDDAAATQLARDFLKQRAARREAVGLSEELIELEQLKEWEEGIAKYGEITTYRLAGTSEVYLPLAEMVQDAEFKSYTGGQWKWDQEITQILRESTPDGDGRFYYSGFGQAVLLDRLAPGWQAHLFDSGVTLESLLDEAVQRK